MLLYVKKTSYASMCRGEISYASISRGEDQLCFYM